MALKQSSLFDFIEDPAEKKLPAKKTAEVKEEVLPVVNEEPVEVDFTPAVAEPETPPPATSQPVIAPRTGRGRRKISEAAQTADLIEIPDDEELFSKKYYAIGVVAQMFKVNISLLRFWEKEFDVLKPKKNGKGDRHFRPEDVKNLQLIHHLLREKKYTIEGAKDFLKKNKKADDAFAVIEELKKLKLFLNELKLSV